MEQLTSAITQALENENWYAALSLSLTAPDICARLESDDQRTDGSRYAEWFQKNLAHLYRIQVGVENKEIAFLTGNDCYALRCALLHEGTADITSQRRREVLNSFHFIADGAHCNRISHDGREILQLSVKTFCSEICDAVKLWLVGFRKHQADKVGRLDELLTIQTGSHTFERIFRFELPDPVSRDDVFKAGVEGAAKGKAEK